MSRNIENIENYLSGKMSNSEKVEFEQELSTNAELKGKVRKMQIIDAALELAIEEDLRASLIKMAAPDKSGLQLPRRLRRIPLFRLAAAASVLILVSIGLWFISGKDSLSVNAFAENSYVEYDYNNLRSGGTATDELPPHSLKLIEQGDIQGATVWHEDWLEDHPNDTEARFVLATLYHLQKKYVESRTTFLQVAQSNSLLWSEKAEWNYICISLLDKWDSDAQNMLDAILASEEHSYYSRALELKKVLNK